MFAKRLLYKVLPHVKGPKMVTYLDLEVALHYGIPYTSSIIAFDPIQRLLALGTLDGRIKIVGGDNIEGLLISPNKLPYKYLEFLHNQGFLIGVTNDNDIQVWNLEHRRLACSRQWETNITAFAIIHGTSLMYIGDENGMLYVLRYDSEAEKLLNLPYNIPAESIFESAGISCPTYQSVIGILPQPSSSGTRVLIAYENGVMILWDVSESLVVTVRGYTDLELKEDETKIVDDRNVMGDEQEEMEICSLCWVTSSGSILAVGYINGDILLWDLSSDSSKSKQSASSLSSKVVVKLQLASGTRRLPVIVLNWSANASLNDNGGQLLIYGGDDMGSEEVLTILNLEWASGVDSLKCLSRADLKLSGSFADMILIPNAGVTEHRSTDALFVLTNPGQLNVYDGALLPILKTDEDKCIVEAEKFPVVIPSIDPCITVTKMCLLDPGSDISKGFSNLADTEKRDESPTLSCGTRWPLTGGVSNKSVPENGIERIFIAAYQDGSVRIWDATCPTLSLVLFLQAKVPGIEVDNQCASVSALDFCSTNTGLAVGNECGLVRIYKLFRNTDESSIHMVSQTTHEVFAAPKGDGYHCTAIFLFSNSFVQTLAFTPYGEKLAVGFKNGQVAVLDMNSWSIVFCSDCSACTPSPVISITFFVDPHLNSNTEIILILKKDAHIIIIDSISGRLVSSHQMHTKKQPTAISMYVIGGDNHVAGIASEKPSKDSSKEKSFQKYTPSNECSSATLKSDEPFLDSFLLLCHDDLLWFGPLKSVAQGSSDYVHKANLVKRCCWSAVFKRNEDGLGLILLYETGDIEMRSLPNLEISAENSLMSVLRWSFKTNMEKTMSSCASGLIAMVNGCELAIISLLEYGNDFRIPECVPCLHDKVVAAAADAAISLSANQKKKQRPRYGILGGILKGLKGTKSENDPDVSTGIEIPNSTKLEEFFSKDPFVNASTIIASDNEEELRIDDIDIDDVVPMASSSAAVNKLMKSSESAEREKLFEGATVNDKPRIRTPQEIITQYRFNGDAQAAAAHAKDKLMERQEKLERISLHTAELQENAQNFSELAHELARRMEKKKWWQI